MKKINLEEILFRHIDSLKDGSPIRNLLINNEIYQNDLSDFFIKLMKEACQETLKLAAENIRWTSGQYKSDYFSQQQSILNTINEIE